MTILFFIVYLGIFVWLINRINFFKNSGLSANWISILFVSKIGAGLIYAWFYSRLRVENADTWNYFNMSKTGTDVLLHNPFAFIKDFFTYGYATAGNLFGENSYWNDIKSDAIIKLMAVFNVFTLKNYYANLIFFNFFFFFGPVALFRLMIGYFPDKKLLLIISIFFMPSFFFWCSGAHKDGLIFSAIALIIYFFNKQLQVRNFVLKYWLVILICFASLFVFRNFLLFLLMPAFFCWWLATRKPKFKWHIFIAVYSLGIILFFSIAKIFPSLNFPQYVISKQNEFKALSGNSVISVPELLPTFKSFFSFFPAALDVAFLRPHLTESFNPSYLISALENIFFIILILLAIIFRDKKSYTNSYVVFAVFFFLSEIILSGYTVTFSGSIMRYKSILQPIICSILFMLIDFSKIFSNKLEKK